MQRDNSMKTPLAAQKPAWQRYLKIALDAVVLFVVGFALTCFRLSFNSTAWQLGISMIYYYAFISFYLRAKKDLGKIGSLILIMVVMGLVVFVVNKDGYFPVLPDTVQP